MSEFLGESKSDIQAIIKDLQEAADKLIGENDKAIEWASNEISLYREYLAYVMKSLIGKPIYYASPEWKKVETHTITGVKVEIQEDGFFGEEYKGEIVVKVFVDNDEGFFIAENLGKTLFLSWDEALKVAGIADKRKK